MNHKAYTTLEYNTTNNAMRKNFKTRKAIPVAFFVSVGNEETHEWEVASKVFFADGIL